jgi:hypothetical protein
VEAIATKLKLPVEIIVECGRRDTGNSLLKWYIEIRPESEKDSRYDDSNKFITSKPFAERRCFIVFPTFAGL